MTTHRKNIETYSVFGEKIMGPYASENPFQHFSPDSHSEVSTPYIFSNLKKKKNTWFGYYFSPCIVRYPTWILISLFFDLRNSLCFGFFFFFCFHPRKVNTLKTILKRSYLFIYLFSLHYQYVLRRRKIPSRDKLFCYK